MHQGIWTLYGLPEEPGLTDLNATQSLFANSEENEDAGPMKHQRSYIWPPQQLRCPSILPIRTRGAERSEREGICGEHDREGWATMCTCTLIARWPDMGV